MIRQLFSLKAFICFSVFFIFLTIGTSAEAQFACPEAKADIWFGMDESGSVDNAEFNDGLDFMYQVSDAFNYDALTGMQGGAFAWWTTTVDNVIPVSEDFGDPGDSGLIQDGNIVINNNGLGIRELYPNRQGSGGTDLALATQHMANLINAGNGRRADTTQVGVILTDASNSQLVNTASGGGAGWIAAADNLRNAGPDGVKIVLVLIAEAATSYNSGTSKSVVDQVVGTGGLLLTVPTYSAAADPTAGYVDSLIGAVCNQACNENDPNADCDEDGIPNGEDPNPSVAFAGDDAMSVYMGTGATITITDNDDFMAGTGISITDTETGTASGIVLFDPLLGTATYTPDSDESGSEVTVVYEICWIATGACATATITIDVLCDPNDDAQDCDRDGNPNGSDPNPEQAVANDDGVFFAIPGEETIFQIIENDDFIAGTGITIVDTEGGTAGGSITFDPLLGTVSYLPLEGEIGTDVTIEYEVCSVEFPAVCATATVSLTVRVPSKGSASSVNRTFNITENDDENKTLNDEDDDSDDDSEDNEDTPSEDPVEDEDDIPETIVDQLDPEVALEIFLDCSETLATYRETSSCYYQDGVFNPSQWTDIAGLPQEANIKTMTAGCYYHGVGDSQQAFMPNNQAVQGSVVKLATRMGRLLPEGFSHFDESPDTRHLPYYQAAQNNAILEGTVITIDSVYQPLSVQDVIQVYNNLMEMKGATQLSITDLPVANNPSAIITRAELAAVSQQFHAILYPNALKEIPEDVQACLDLIDTTMIACNYDDGTFDGSQWLDIEGLQYEDAVRNITNRCLIHGANDSQEQYHPFVDATNAAAMKIIARMGGYLPEGFHHNDALVWFEPYYQALQAKGLLTGLAVYNENDSLSLYNLVAILSRIGSGTMSIQSVPVQYRAVTVNRGSLAVIVDLYMSMFTK